MSFPKYREMEYELPRAIILVEDIALQGGLMQGGEQYPNSLSVIDSAQSLRGAITRGIPPEYSENCLSAVAVLCDLFEDIWRKGNILSDATIVDLTKAADQCLTRMPQIWVGEG